MPCAQRDRRFLGNTKCKPSVAFCRRRLAPNRSCRERSADRAESLVSGRVTQLAYKQVVRPDPRIVMRGLRIIRVVEKRTAC